MPRLDGNHFMIVDDGEALSFAAVRANFRQVLSAVRNDERNGWRVLAVDVNWEDPSLYCAHTNERIESAYAEDQAIK